MRRRWQGGSAAAVLIASILATAAPAKNAAAQGVVRRVVSAEPVRMVIELDPSSARVAEPVSLTVRVEAPPSAEVKMPPLESPLGRWEVGALRHWDALPGEAVDGEPIRRWVRRAQLESIRAGEFELPPLEARYRLDRSSPWRSLRSEPVPVRIRSVLPASADPREFRELKPPVAVEPVERASARWREALFGSVAALLIGIAIVAYRWARRRHAAPAATARRRLNRLAQHSAESRGAAPSSDSVYLELEQVLRDFFAQRFGMAAHSQSTEELIQSLEAAGGLGRAQQEKLATILRTADQIKYARQAAPHEAGERAIAEAREVIDRIAAGRPASGTPAREVA